MFALSRSVRHGRDTRFMRRYRLAAVLAVSMLTASGCAGLRQRIAPARNLGAPVALPPEARPLGHFFTGEMALAQNDPERALREFEAAVAADPDTPMLRLRL